MWDDNSLPAYTGSFSDNIILLTLYLQWILYNVVMVLGVLFIIGICLSPIVIGYFGIKSLKIKIKHHKSTSKINKKNKEKLQNKTTGYLSHLQKISKKYHKKNAKK